MDARALAFAALGGIALFVLGSRRAEAASAPYVVPDYGIAPGEPFPQYDSPTPPLDLSPFFDAFPSYDSTPVYSGGDWDFLPPVSAPEPVYSGGEWDYLPPPIVAPEPAYSGGEWDFLPPYVEPQFEPYTVGDIWPTQPEATPMPADQASVNLEAMKAAIAAAEGTDPNPRGWNPYGVTVGYEFEINDFSDHPARLGWPGNRLAGVLSTAAGKYQALASTWRDFVAYAGPRDFSPASQEAFADWAIIVKRNAGPEVAAGDFAGALQKLSWEWASLPPGRYGQPLRSQEWLAAHYAQAGGTFAPSNAMLAQAVGGVVA